MQEINHLDIFQHYLDIIVIQLLWKVGHMEGAGWRSQVLCQLGSHSMIPSVDNVTKIMIQYPSPVSMVATVREVHLQLIVLCNPLV